MHAMQISISQNVYYTLAQIFHLLTHILATKAKPVPNIILPALNPITPTKLPLSALNNAPTIGVPVNPLSHQLCHLRSEEGVYAIEQTALDIPIMVPISRRSLQILVVRRESA
jgi:hypothetical protein